MKRNHYIQFHPWRRYWVCEFECYYETGAYEEFEKFAKYWGVDVIKPE